MGIIDWFRARRLKPGQKVSISGQYRNSHTLKQVTCVRGERCPPGPRGSYYLLTDKTRHIGG